MYLLYYSVRNLSFTSSCNCKVLSLTPVFTYIKIQTVESDLYLSSVLQYGNLVHYDTEKLVHFLKDIIKHVGLSPTVH